VTTCTDLLRAGGYGRLSHYLLTLEERMRAVGASTIAEFVSRSAAATGDASGDAPSLVNARTLLAKALADPRYHADQNRTPPRKLGTRLWLWDCLSCSKCVPACPNDAIFELDSEPFLGEVPTIAVDGDGWRETGRAIYRAMKSTQIAIFADACNACGNCDVYCPEDGGPYIEKPLVFGSLAAWRRAAPLKGFVLTREDGRDVLRGRFTSGERTLTHEPGASTAVFDSDEARLTIDWASHRVLDATLVAPAEAGTHVDHDSATHAMRSSPQSWDPASAGSRPAPAGASDVLVDLAHYLTLRTLMDALLRPSRVHFANAPLLEP
jgi:putative selenate reductase